MNTLPIPKPLPSIPLYNDINKNNIIELQLIINYIIDSSSLISLDTEFTGLGKLSDGIRAKNLTDRYIALKNVASKYALVAFGLSLFLKSENQKEDQNCIQYQNHSFNFLMLPQHDYLQSSKSMKFLIENGFDFNNQALKGIPYFPGENRINDNNPLSEYNKVMRRIFNRILKRARKVPVIVHNGLMDLMFLYQSFFAPLPDKLDTFIVDLAKMFPCGIYDTKYIADYVLRESSSFLSYLFRKEERIQLYNKNIKKSKYIKCLIKKKINCIEQLKKKKVPMKRPLDTGKIYCEQYAAHGFCIFGKDCTKTHNLDVILDEQMKEKLKPSKRKRRKDRKKMRLEKQKEEVLNQLNEIINSNNVKESNSEMSQDSNNNNKSDSNNNTDNNENNNNNDKNDTNNNDNNDNSNKNEISESIANQSKENTNTDQISCNNNEAEQSKDSENKIDTKSDNSIIVSQKENENGNGNTVNDNDNKTNSTNDDSKDDKKEIGSNIMNNNDDSNKMDNENDSINTRDDNKKIKENNKTNISNDSNNMNKKDDKEENSCGKPTENENDSETDEPEVVEPLIIFENQGTQNQSNLQYTHAQSENINNGQNPNIINTSSVVIKNFETYHSAYFDAFMTGYVFCCQCIESEEEILGSEHVNKLYIIGKPMPLLIHSSPYTKNSEQCLKILETI
ncbi:ribonuclease CAF1 [Piromyces finnis]|uniref:Ribonuclease CAF1 n=1 Tax=Piromyces finnis TaxID=1754191 RepID=A0A1Y1VAG3_9FUNG|nr:ribonuclease CAF1 [Piromyces finnis]|eukprot:ORX50675.1 ribonuclease CAF1 [Piromyces finnis]